MRCLLGFLVCCAAVNAMGDDDYMVVHPKQIETKLTNPDMGFVYLDPAMNTELGDVLYISSYWGELEPEEGVYNWGEGSKLRAYIDAARARGDRVALRVPACWPRTETPTPQWVFDLGVKKFDCLHTEGDPKKDREQRNYSCFYEPEIWNPIFIEKHCNFIKAMGKEFDGEPWLEYIDMRHYGRWGEGHRYNTKEPWPEDVDKRELLKIFIDAYVEAFPNTPVVTQVSDDNHTPYPKGTAIDYALSKGAWMRRDGFGPHVKPHEAAFINEHFPTSVMIAENAGRLFLYVDGLVKRRRGEGPPSISIDELFDEMLDLHCNYVPLGYGRDCWNVLRQRPDILKKLWMNMGYRFIINEARFDKVMRRGEPYHLEIDWQNIGVGRLPEVYPMEVYLIDNKGNRGVFYTDEDFDLTACLTAPGYSNTYNQSVTHTLDMDVPPGEYFLAVALVDPETREPAIALGIEGSDQERRYILGKVAVEPAAE